MHIRANITCIAGSARRFLLIDRSRNWRTVRVRRERDCVRQKPAVASDGV